MKTLSRTSSYLFSRPSFLEGFSRIFDFSSSLNTYNDSPTEQEADMLALSNDWKAIGMDVKVALCAYTNQLVDNELYKKLPESITNYIALYSTEYQREKHPAERKLLTHGSGSKNFVHR